jgi:hypothetical protein
MRGDRRLIADQLTEHREDGPMEIRDDGDHKEALAQR